MLNRVACPYCTRKHLASARRVLWELMAHGDNPADPHLEIFIAELEHAEQQSPYAQLTERIRALKKIFDDQDIWTVEDLVKYTTANNFDWDRGLVECINELRELYLIERNQRVPQIEGPKQRDMK